MLPMRAVGQRFILLNGAVTQVSGALQDAGLPTRWKVGPASLDIGHPAYVTIDVEPTLKALRPLRPAHIRAVRESGGVTISWIRQTRSGGDAWELGDVPLSEDSESYVLTVMNGAVAARVFNASVAQQFYSDAQMIADFAAVPLTLTLRVAQVSAAFGAGTVLERVLNV